METAEYADVNNLLEEPTFKWWAKKMLKKNDRIVSRVKYCYWITSHKFVIALPHFVEKSYVINEDNGNTFWGDYIEK